MVILVQLRFRGAKEDVGQTLGTYGIGGDVILFFLFWSTTVRDTVGMFADTFVDPFSTVTWRERA